MRIVPIFADRLYSFQYESEECDELERLFDCWQDPSYLYQFFLLHEADLQGGFYGTISLRQAVLNTKTEAKRLENELLAISRDNSGDLSDLFKPLSNNERGDFQRSKAKGDTVKSWLRIYALKIPETSAYIVTGGAIKLTESMNVRTHTEQELKKMQRCVDFLREQGFTDIEGFKELDL